MSSASIRLNANAEAWQGPRRTAAGASTPPPAADAAIAAVPTARTPPHVEPPLRIAAEPTSHQSTTAGSVAQLVVFNNNVANVGAAAGDYRVGPTKVHPPPSTTLTSTNKWVTPPQRPRDLASVGPGDFAAVYQSPQHLGRMPSPPMMAAVQLPTTPPIARHASGHFPGGPAENVVWAHSQRHPNFRYGPRRTPPPASASSPPPQGIADVLALPPPLHWRAQAPTSTAAAPPSASPVIFDGVRVRDSNLRRAQAAASSAERGSSSHVRPYTANVVVPPPSYSVGGVSLSHVSGTGALLFDGTAAGASVHRTPDASFAAVVTPAASAVKATPPASAVGQQQQRATWPEPSIGGASLSSAPASATALAAAVPPMCDSFTSYPVTAMSAPVIPTSTAPTLDCSDGSDDETSGRRQTSGDMTHTTSQLQALVDRLS